MPAQGYGDWGGPYSDQFFATGTNSTYSTAVNWTRTFSNTFLMESRGGVSYYHNIARHTAWGKNLAEEVGIEGVNLDDWTSGPPRINIGNGFSSPALGYSTSLPWDRYERTWEIASTLTKLWGNHTIKFGADWRHNTDMLLQTQDNQGPRGGYTFGAAMTGLPTDSASQSGMANAFAAFLLDRPGGIARDLKVIDEPGTKHWSFFTFVHDKWQLSRRITLDLGLRWEYYDPFVGIEGKGSPRTTTRRPTRCGSPATETTRTTSASRRTSTTSTLVSAISYRLDEKTVIRAGYGASTTPFPDNRYAFNFPVKQNNSFSGPNTFSPAGSMAAGFPAPIVMQIPADGIIAANTSLLLSQSFWHVPADVQQGTLHSWNLAFQRELISGLTGEVAWVGNRGNDVLNRFQMNAGMTPGLDRAGQPLYVAFGKTAGVELLAWKGKTRYQGLQVKLDRRFRNGFLVTNSYTYSKAKDYANENGGPSTPANPELSWGYGDNDRTHVYTGSFVWALPWFREGGVAKWVLGHWQVSGLLTAMSGTPLDVTMSGALLRAPSNTQRPDQNGEAKILGNYGPGKK